MITFQITINFTEPNGLAKEAEMQHTIPYQLNQLARFWSTQYGITSEKYVNDDNSQKIVTYKVPSTETKEEFLQHATDNGVDITNLIQQYKTEVEKLGGTFEYTISDDIPD